MFDEAPMVRWRVGHLVSTLIEIFKAVPVLMKVVCVKDETHTDFIGGVPCLTDAKRQLELVYGRFG